MKQSITNSLFLDFSQWHQDYSKNEDFQAIMFEGKLRPFDKGAKEVFTYGISRKKIGKKVVDVPKLSPDTDLNDYLQKYGDNCLFYALTGRLINSSDCSWTNIENEFSAMVFLGIDQWIPFITRVKTLRGKVNEIYIKNYGIYADNKIMQSTNKGNIVFRQKLFTISLQHYIIWPIRSAPHFDVLKDDERLFNTYYFCNMGGDYEVVKEDKVFPVSQKERLEFLFGEDVAKEYEELMHYFGLDGKKQTKKLVTA